MSLTVAIANYNHAPHLKKCLASAKRYADEVIVIDNASTDGSQRIIKASGVKSVLRRKNKGLLASLNQLIEMAESTHILFLDSDDYLSADPHSHCEGDWCVAPLEICSAESDTPHETWRWKPINTRAEAIAQLRCNHGMIPLHMKGVFRVAWIRDNGLRFEDWPDSPNWAEDCYTSLEWLKAEPEVIHRQDTVYVYRRVPHPRDKERAYLARLAKFLREQEGGRGSRRLGELRYPVPIAHDCVLDGRTYPAGSRIDHATALALKAAGQLMDERIV